MGGIKFKTLHDLAKMDAHVDVTCSGCGREVVLERRGVIEWFVHKRYNPSMDIAGTYFRCSVCGHKGARVRAVAMGKDRELEPPKVIYER